ncbi:MAG: PHP domain-containing protein [SAR202 cluster bacterium]|nr:PHP domain-containing protein [SAR202 cluster bacterium]
MIRADFHIHTRYSPDSDMPLKTLVARCLKAGLGCIAVTDHNTIEGALETARIAPFTVIIGEEVKSSGGEIIGLFLKERIAKNLTPLETVQAIKAQGGLVSIPHPFDGFRRNVITSAALAEVLPHTDIIEGFNARNTFQSANRRAQELARQRGIPVSAVTDSHTPHEVGRTYTEMREFDGTPAGFLRALADARLEARPVTPFIHLLTRYTKVRKRLLGR